MDAAQAHHDICMFMKNLELRGKIITPTDIVIDLIDDFPSNSATYISNFTDIVKYLCERQNWYKLYL